MRTDPKLEPGAYVSGDDCLYEVLGVDTATDEVLLENCRDFSRRRVPVRTMTDKGSAWPSAAVAAREACADSA